MKPIYLLFILSAAIASFFSCSKERNDCCSVISLALNFNVLSVSKGGDTIDMLNPETESYFNEDSIDLYYETAPKVFTKFYQSNLDYPKNVHIFKNGTEKYTLQVFVNPTTLEARDHLTQTLIKIGKGAFADTVKANLDINAASKILNKAYLNGKSLDLSKPNKIFVE